MEGGLARGEGVTAGQMGLEGRKRGEDRVGIEMLCSQGWRRGPLCL